MDIGQRIKSRRLQLGLTLEELAKKLNVNKSTVHRYETSEIKNMSINVIKPIADALLTTPSYLMGWDDEAIAEIEQKQKEAHEPTSIPEWLEQLQYLKLNAAEIDQVVNFAKYITSQRGSGSDE